MNHDNDLGRIREDLRARSRQIFGKQHRLEITALISAQEPPIWSRRLARSLDIGENQAASEISSLAQIGALQRFPAEHDRRKVHQPVPHPIWEFSRRLLEDTIRALEPAAGDSNVALYWEAVLDQADPQPIPQADDSQQGEEP
jgi:hypothetical protein